MKLKQILLRCLKQLDYLENLNALTYLTKLKSMAIVCTSIDQEESSLSLNFVKNYWTNK